jgi:hypothetical protein
MAECTCVVHFKQLEVGVFMRSCCSSMWAKHIGKLAKTRSLVMLKIQSAGECTSPCYEILCASWPYTC